jgi:hypothetical protein
MFWSNASVEVEGAHDGLALGPLEIVFQVQAMRFRRACRHRFDGRDVPRRDRPRRGQHDGALDDVLSTRGGMSSRRSRSGGT